MIKQISDNEIYLLIKYTKSVFWRVAKRLSYIQDARCLKVKEIPVIIYLHSLFSVKVWSVFKFKPTFGLRLGFEFNVMNKNQNKMTLY